MWVIIRRCFNGAKDSVQSALNLARLLTIFTLSHLWSLLQRTLLLRTHLSQRWSRSCGSTEDINIHDYCNNVSVCTSIFMWGVIFTLIQFMLLIMLVLIILFVSPSRGLFIYFFRDKGHIFMDLINAHPHTKYKMTCLTAAIIPSSFLWNNLSLN